MRLVAFVVVLGCGSPVSSVAPVTPPRPSPIATTPPTTPTATPDPADAIPAQPAPPGPTEDLVAKLPKQDFAPAFRITKDAAAAKQATALNAAGVGFHTKKDLVNAEAKYVEALAADPGHALARYNLACVYNLTGKTERGLALLAELANADACPACSDAVARAKYDDDWRSQWDREVFWQLTLERDPVLPESCPAGTRKIVKKSNGDDEESWCEKPGGIKHGPYKSAAYMVHCAMACEGSAHESGMYDRGKKVGIWSHAETYGPNWSGGHDAAGNQHGLWLEGDHKEQQISVYVHGVQQGRTRTDFEGHRKFDGSYRDGKLHGPATTYEHWSKLYVSSRGEYVDGDKHGRWTAWNEDGTPESDGVYDRGKQIGRWRSFAGGVLSVVEHYEDGKLHGERITYAGALRASIGHYDHGQRHGEFTYWSGGKQLATTTMDHDTGDWIEYEGDKLIARGKLIKGVRDGAWASIDDGKWAEGAFAAGKRTGTWTFTRDGQKVATGSYTAGARSGEWTLWHDTGKEKARGPFVADQRSGAWTFWNEEGVMIAKGNYAAGKRSGKWELIDSDGEVMQTQMYKAGTLVTVDGKRPPKRPDYEPMLYDDTDEPPAVFGERDPYGP